MTKAFVDSASFSQLVQFLDTGKNYDWSRDTINGLSSMLLFADNIYMAPGLGNAKVTEIDNYDWLITRLIEEDLMKPLRFLDKNKQSQSEHHSIKWTENDQNLNNLTLVVNNLHSGNENFNFWMDWVLHNALKEHSIRFSGLFDTFFLPAVAKVLDITLKEANQLHILSKKYDDVYKLADGGKEDYRLLTKGYIASAMLRGIINNKNAELCGIQIKHHPIRELVLPETSKLSENFPLSNTASFLIGEIIRGAMHQKSLKEKIYVYVENVRKARNYCNSHLALFDDQDKTAHQAQKLACEISNKIDLTIGSKKTKHAFDIGIGLGATVALNVNFNSFIPATLAGFIAGLVANKLNISQKAASYCHRAGRYFHELPPGRIEFKKTKPRKNHGEGL